ncbi:hypothetical protein [Cellulomonas sp. GbtcB1]|uniref:hypothetical protein n=1 Tax=Cellulomonas sp. GbtcB1 TaxID=2824746 RepID=UPI001C2FF91A|nr:hypothetical protein [Cellulomonas sp. GbtcB1]
MPNTLYTAEQAAAVAASLAHKDLNIAGTVSRDVEADFNPGRGLVVPVRIPGATVAGTKDPKDTTTPLDLGSIHEQTVPVEIDVHAFSRVALSEADLSLGLTDYAAQVLAPQSAALASYSEDRVVKAMQATPLKDLAFDEANPARMFTAARAALRKNGVNGATPLLAAVGADVYGALLDGPVSTFDADGKVRGFTVQESTSLAPGEAVFYIRNAFTLVLRAPIAPDGAPFSAAVRAQTENSEFALRLIRAYNPAVAAEESLVSVLVGSRAMPLPVVDTETGTVSLVEHGGAIRVDTASA